MTSFITPQRMESPRMHVLITQVDTTNLTALGSDLKTRGQVTINISIHNTQTVIYPRENEEWFITKINEQWVLDKKCGYGNEGLLREAKPGDQITATSGDYVLDTASVEIVGPTSVDGHLTANSDFSVWGNTDLGPVQMYGRLDLLGDLYMNGHHIHGQGGSIYTDGGHIICNQINCGNIYAKQVAASENSFFDKYVSIYDLQVHHNTTLGRMDVYGDAYHHGWGIDLQGGGLGAGVAVIGGVGIASNGVFPAGKGVWNAGTVDAAYHQSGGAGFNGGGFSVGYSWMNFDSIGVPNASFGGVAINGGGINTGWRNIDAGFGQMWAGQYWLNISEAQFKRDISPVENSQLDAVLNAPLYHYRYNPDAIHPDTNNASEKLIDPDAPRIKASEVINDEVDPEPTIADVSSEAFHEATETWRFGPMIEDLPDQLVGDTPRGKAPDMASLIYTAWGAIQELSGKLDAANEKIASLTHRLEAVGG